MNANEIVRAERLKEITSRHRAATPGPWYYKCFNGTVGISTPVWGMCSEFIEERDADFLTKAREDIPFLLDLIESLQAQLTADSVVSEGIRWADPKWAEQINNRYGFYRRPNSTRSVYAGTYCSDIAYLMSETDRLHAQLSASQRREKAAVEEIEAFTKARMQQLTLEQALVLQPVLNRIYTIRRRGPQEAGEVSYQNVYDTSKRPQQAGEERE